MRRDPASNGHDAGDLHQIPALAGSPADAKNASVAAGLEAGDRPRAIIRPTEQLRGRRRLGAVEKDSLAGGVEEGLVRSPVPSVPRVRVALEAVGGDDDIGPFVDRGSEIGLACEWNDPL
jgi:hypothetical protein